MTKAAQAMTVVATEPAEMRQPAMRTTLWVKLPTGMASEGALFLSRECSYLLRGHVAHGHLLPPAPPDPNMFKVITLDLRPYPILPRSLSSVCHTALWGMLVGGLTVCAPHICLSLTCCLLYWPQPHFSQLVFSRQGKPCATILPLCPSTARYMYPHPHASACLLPGGVLGR